MFWKRTFLLVILCAVLGFLYWQSPKWLRQSAAPAAEAPHETAPIENAPVKTDALMIALEPQESIKQVKVEDLANQRQFSVERRGDSWVMSEPIQFSLDIDVVRFLNSLPDIRVQKKFESTLGALAQFGLDHPQIRLCVSMGEKTRQKCYEFGNNVLNNTACYGKDGDQVIIVPKLVRDLWLGQTEYALARKQVFPVLFYDAEKITLRENEWFVEVVKRPLGWELARPASRKLTAEEVKKFFTFISNLHVRSFLDAKNAASIKWNPNRRIVVDFAGRPSETLLLGQTIEEHSGFSARLSSWKTVFVLSQEKYEELIQFSRELAYPAH